MTGRQPPDEERRPGGRGRRSQNIAGGDAHTVARRSDHSARRAASTALTLMLQRHRTSRPEHFALTRAELRREIARCHQSGWHPWELRTRFTNPAGVPVQGWDR